MRTEKLTVYWIGQEPTGPGKSPELNKMPEYADVVPLAFVTINNEQLDYGFLTQHNSAEVIKGWIQEVKARGTKVLFSIIGKELGTISDPVAFAHTVQQQMQEWDVDGIDFDYEPPEVDGLDTFVEVVQQIRALLGSTAILTTPVYSWWWVAPKPEDRSKDEQKVADTLRKLALYLDYFCTMDYTPYPYTDGVNTTTGYFNNYAQSIGSTEQLAIGFSCMDFTNNDHTPLDDMITLCKWEPDTGKKQGGMMYNFSYDITHRIVNGRDVGTQHPDGTWTQTVQDNLP